MLRSLGKMLGCTAAALVLGAGPATAESVVIGEDAGDASGPLDITRVKVDNGDHALVASVRYDGSSRGNLVVSIDQRGGRGVRLISEHRPVGHTTDLVVGRAFSDHGGSSARIPCPGFRVTWSADEPTVRLRMPSSCLGGGDYGAIRFVVLTEDASGGDSDDSYPVSPWLARG
ncbi:hypothetical protein ABLE68_19425 [Nocardioides sp. CN2-186]|uniref:hypothetical protein n=1 Tax=Nocardioides tweenelious TaxID=3156607 RepID=UPI0032B58FD0